MKNICLNIVFFFSLLGLTSCSSAELPASIGAFNTKHQAYHNDIYNPNFWQDNTDTTWDKLQHISLARLTAAKSSLTNPTEKAWVELAILSKQQSTHTEALVNGLIAWRKQYSSHAANALFPDNAALTALLSAKKPEHIALLLPLKGAYGDSGKTVRDGFLKAYYQNSITNTQQTLAFSDTTVSANISDAYQAALHHGADFIIGPLEKPNVTELSRATGITKPTLALNYSQNNSSTPENLYQYGLLPEDEVIQIADRARDSGLSRALIIAPNDDWGKRMASAFSKQWTAYGGGIQDAWYYEPKQNFSKEVANLLHVDTKQDKKLMHDDNHKNVLEKQRRQDFDVIFLFAQAPQAGLIVPLLKYYYVNNTPIYATASVYTGNATTDADLRGVTICDIPANQAGGDVNRQRLYAFGQDAYLLSQALPQLQTLPNFPIYGKTGALTLSQHQIHRRLPCITRKA